METEVTRQMDGYIHATASVKMPGHHTVAADVEDAEGTCRPGRLAPGDAGQMALG